MKLTVEKRKKLVDAMVSVGGFFTGTNVSTNSTMMGKPYFKLLGIF